MIEVQVAKDGSTAVVVMRNESRLNAFSLPMWSALREAFEELSGREDLRCIMLRGAGTAAFSAGADISEFEATRGTFEQVVEFHEKHVGPCLASIGLCPIPVVAGIRGVCMGGGLEIASACDIRIADKTARFGAPVGRLGFPLAFGETEALFRLVGPAVSAEILIEGRVFVAEEALQRGLLTRVIEMDRFEEEVASTMASIRASGILAARSHKRQIRRLSLDGSAVSLAERMEVYRFAETREYQEGYRTFLDRRRKGSKIGRQ